MIWRTNALNLILPRVAFAQLMLCTAHVGSRERASVSMHHSLAGAFVALHSRMLFWKPRLILHCLTLNKNAPVSGKIHSLHVSCDKDPS